MNFVGKEILILHIMKALIRFAEESEKLFSMFPFNAEKKIMLVPKSRKKFSVACRAGGNKSLGDN